MQYYNYAHSNDSNDTYDDSDTNEYWKNMYLSQKYDENYYNKNNINYQTTIQTFNRYNFNSNQKIIITIKIQTT